MFPILCLTREMLLRQAFTLVKLGSAVLPTEPHYAVFTQYILSSSLFWNVPTYMDPVYPSKSSSSLNILCNN